MGKLIYIYSNDSICRGGSIQDDELLENENVIFHSKEVSKRTINKEKKDNKFLHIFKKHTNVYSDYYSYYTSYCLY